MHIDSSYTWFTNCQNSGQLEHLKKLFPDTNSNTEIPDMSGKFRTYGNPTTEQL